MKKDSPFYKMQPGSKEMDSPTAFSGKDQSTMSAFNYGAPLNNVGGKKKTTAPKIKTEELEEVVVYAPYKNRKRPSEVGGTDAQTSGGKKFKAIPGKPVI